MQRKSIFLRSLLYQRGLKPLFVILSHMINTIALIWVNSVGIIIWGPLFKRKKTVIYRRCIICVITLLRVRCADVALIDCNRLLAFPSQKLLQWCLNSNHWEWESTTCRMKRESSRGIHEATASWSFSFLWSWWNMKPRCPPCFALTNLIGASAPPSTLSSVGKKLGSKKGSSSALMMYNGTATPGK